MKIIILISLIFLVSCKATTKRPKEVAADDTSNALTALQGTWELCSVSGGSYGDYKITHNITGNIYSFTEYRYRSVDGSCTTPIFRSSGVQTIAAGSGNPALWNEAVPIDMTFTAPIKMTALTGDTEALDEVTRCSGESSPAVGMSYDVINECHATSLFYDPAVANQKRYTIFNIDYSRLPDLYLSLGSPPPPEDGSTEALRNIFLDVAEYSKK